MIGRFKPGIWALAVVSLLNSTGFSLSLPFLALYLHEQRGLSMTLVGIIFFGSGVLAAVTQMAAGALSDRFGRRPLLLATLVLAGLSYFAMAALIGVQAAVVTIVLVYAVVRSALMMQRPAIAAIVADLTPRDNLTETYGLIRVAQNIGWAAGPAIGGYLALSLSYGRLFAIGGGVVVLAFLFGFLFFKESSRGSVERVTITTMLSVGKDRRFLTFTILAMLAFLIMGQMGSTLSVFTVDRVGFTTAQYGFLLTLNGLIVILFQYPVTRISAQAPKYLIMALGSFLWGVGYLGMSWVGAYVLALAASVVVTAGEIIFTPTSYAVAGELAPEQRRGHYMGFFGLSETLGMSFGPLIGGILLDAFPTRYIFIWGVICLIGLIAAVGFLRWGKTRYKSLAS